jgi:hypothetical protein
MAAIVIITSMQNRANPAERTVLTGAPSKG